MKTMNNLISEEYIQALGWTLLHSIWQAAGIALLLAILMIFLQGSSKIRYLVSISALPLVLICSLATFRLSYQNVAHNPSNKGIETMVVPLQESAHQEGNVIASENISHSTGFVSQFKSYFSSHFPLIVTLWFLGMIVLTLRFLGGLAYVQRLKRYKVVNITPLWEEKLHKISHQIGLQKSVKLLESSMVAVPMVVGYLKPVILLPVGAVTGLSMHQVEAILAHELAHIYRKDYLINIFQTLIEILFFYHPAIWWISSRVREERENCCDDIAVQVKGNSLVYAKALTTLGEMHTGTPTLAMAATGNSGYLLKRIKRLLTQPRQSPTFSEGFITACIVIVGIFSLSLVAKSDFTYDGHKSDTATVMTSTEDGKYQAFMLSFPDSTGNDNNLIIIKNKKGKITELYVNGQKVPKDEIKNYSASIEKSMAQQNHKRAASDNPEQEAALKKMLDEIEDQDDMAVTDEETETPEIPEQPESAEEPEFYKESAEVFKDFSLRTIEIAKMGMEMGKLSMEMESLQKELLDPENNTKRTEAAIQKLNKEIKATEVKIEMLGKELEKSGEEMGKMSLEIAISAMDSIGSVLDSIDFSDFEDMEDHEKEDQ